MEVELFKKAYCLAESLDTCDNAKYIIEETQKRLQKEFDEL